MVFTACYSTKSTQHTYVRGTRPPQNNYHRPSTHVTGSISKATLAVETLQWEQRKHKLSDPEIRRTSNRQISPRVTFDLLNPAATLQLATSASNACQETIRRTQCCNLLSLLPVDNCRDHSVISPVPLRGDRSREPPSFLVNLQYDTHLIDSPRTLCRDDRVIRSVPVVKQNTCFPQSIHSPAHVSISAPTWDYHNDDDHIVPKIVPETTDRPNLHKF